MRLVGVLDDATAGSAALLSETLRLEGVQANSWVDYAFILCRPVGEFIRVLKPHFVVKGKEHEWGFGRTHSGKTLSYRVEHEVWDVYDVQSYALDVDFGLLYGEKWGFLADEKPLCSVFALGSPVKVYPKGDLSHVHGEPMDGDLPPELKES